MAKEKVLIQPTKNNFLASYEVPEELKKFLEGCVYYDTDSWNNRQYYIRMNIKKTWYNIYITQDKDTHVFNVLANYTLVENLPEKFQRSLRLTGFSCDSTDLGTTILGMIKFIRENKQKIKSNDIHKKSKEN